MPKMNEQTFEEFKREVMDTATRHYETQAEFNKEEAFKFALEYSFKMGHIRGEWAGSKGIIE